jgi:membrane-associated phospholipid phosphatase
MRYALLLAFLVPSLASAGGDPAPVAGTGSGAGVGSAAGSGGMPGATAGSADIPAPAPDAPKDKVEHAKEVAKTADLTPIIPNPNNPTKPAFLLYAEIDPPIVATGLVFALARRTRTQQAFCLPDCTKDAPNLNSIDKLTAGYYSQQWSLASDIGLYGLVAGAGTVLVLDEGFLPALNDGVVLAESTIGATAVASVMTLAAGRPRPFLYAPEGQGAPDSVRQGPDAALSFISSHTAMSFAVTTSLFVAEHRLHPTSNKPYIILGAGLAIASGVGVARVMSGYHFITDVVGGAVVGSSIGVLVSAVHKSPVHVVPITNHDAAGNLTGAGAAISGSF